MHIDSYSFGRMTVDGDLYQKDLIVFPDKIQSDWWRKEGHVLHLEDLKEVIDYKPGILVVGTGDSGMMQVPADTRTTIENIGIKFITENTHKAYKIFNEAVEKGEDVVGAFHLTC
jgi:hypothetical protein